MELPIELLVIQRLREKLLTLEELAEWKREEQKVMFGDPTVKEPKGVIKVKA